MTVQQIQQQIENMEKVANDKEYMIKGKEINQLHYDICILTEALLFYMDYHTDSRNWGLIDTKIKEALDKVSTISIDKS